jgi:hypothetical protein
MKKFRSIEIGSDVAFYSNAGRKKIEGSEKPNGQFLARKMFYTKPIASGVVVKIKGHNAHACQITFDNGKTFEMGLDTHYHLNGEIGDCVAHQDNYSMM